MLFSLLLRREEHCHSLSFQDWQLVNLCILFQVVSKSEQQNFSLFLEQDRAAFEEYVRLNLSPVLQKLYCVTQFEIVVMVVCLRSETNLFNYNFSCFCFKLFFPLLLLVKELLIINNPTNRRCGVRRNFDKVEFLLIRYLTSLLYCINTRLYVFTYQTNFFNANFFVNSVGEFLCPSAVVVCLFNKWLSCDNLILLKFVNY